MATHVYFVMSVTCSESSEDEDVPRYAVVCLSAAAAALMLRRMSTVEQVRVADKSARRITYDDARSHYFAKLPSWAAEAYDEDGNETVRVQPPGDWSPSDEDAAENGELTLDNEQVEVRAGTVCWTGDPSHGGVLSTSRVTRGQLHTVLELAEVEFCGEDGCGGVGAVPCEHHIQGEITE